MGDPSIDLIAGTQELIADLVCRLQAGETFDNPKLTELAEQFFGGTRSQGAYSLRDVYDAFEVAVNQHLLAGEARRLMLADEGGWCEPTIPGAQIDLRANNFLAESPQKECGRSELAVAYLKLLEVSSSFRRLCR